MDYQVGSPHVGVALAGAELAINPQLLLELFQRVLTTRCSPAPAARCVRVKVRYSRPCDAAVVVRRGRVSPCIGHAASIGR